MIIYHDFLSPLRRGSHFKSDNTHIITQPLKPIYLTPAPWVSVVAPIFSLPQPHHVTASHPSPGDNHQSTRGRSERTQGQAKISAWNSFSYICTMEDPPLFHIFRALQRSLDRHSWVVKSHHHTIHQIIIIVLNQDYTLQLVYNKIQMAWLTCWQIIWQHLNQAHIW